MASPKNLDALSPAEKRALLKQLLERGNPPAAPSTGTPGATGALTLATGPVRRPADEAPVPSFAQERMWFLNQLQPGAATYNVPEAAELNGTVDPGVLDTALRHLLARHPALRATFPTSEGLPRLAFQDVPTRVLEVEELAPEADGDGLEARISRRLREEATRPFDLEHGPLYRFRLFRVSPQRHVMLLVVHHIVFDGWSINVLMRELREVHAALGRQQEPRLPPVALEYSDFAAWQRQPAVSAREAELLEYWKRQLTDAQALLQLPTDLPRPAVRSTRGAETPLLQLPAALTESVRAFCRERQVSPFMVFQAAFSALLHRYSQQTDFCVGTPVSGRTHPSVEGLVGLFVNTLVLRTRVAPSSTFSSLLAQVRTTTLEALAHQDVPFERLVNAMGAERSLSQTPLFQVMFDLYRVEHSLADALSSPGLQTRPVRVDTRACQFDLSLSVYESTRGFNVFLRYCEDLFTPATVERMRGHYVQLLTHALREPQARLDTLQLLTPEERQAVLHHARPSTRDWSLDTCLHEYLPLHARTAPQRVALAFRGGRWTYGELEVHTNRAAHRMVSHGVGPERIVAILSPRTEGLIRALISVHKAGGAYLPLDAQLPAARVAQLLAESRAPFVLPLGETHALLSEALALLPETQRPHVLPLEGLDSESPEPLPRRATPDNLAYVVFTSGSTGTPKGVMCDHRGMLNHALWLQEDLSLTPDDVLSQTAGMGFDISIWQMIGPLCFGGGTYVFDDDVIREHSKLAAALVEAGSTVHQMVPPVFQNFLEELEASNVRGLGRLRWQLLGGQALPSSLCRAWFARFPHIGMVHAYGPAECTDTATHHYMRTPREAPAGTWSPIGTPKANLEVYLLDEALQPVPVGVVGEIFIGGVGVGRGYLDHPEWTAERFVPHPLSTRPGERLYRTGDLARLRADGLFEFVTRADFQVKVRGVRIELAEVDAALQALPEVREAAVLAREVRPGEKLLVAFVAPAQAGTSAASLQQALARSLPAYMVPSRFLLLEALPLNANGKVDRKALEALPLESAEAQSSGEPPRGPVEELLAQLFRQVLGVEKVHREDNFFHLGGHSLSATRLVARVRQSFDAELPLPAFFASPTVAGLARELSQLQGTSAQGLPAPTPRPEGSPPVLSSAQERLWFIQQLQPDSSAYHTPEAIELTGPLDTEALRQSLRWLLERHPVLRLFIPSREGQPHPVLLPVPQEPLRFESLEGLPDARERLASRLREEVHRPFSLEAGALYRFWLLKLGPEHHVLLLVFHHLLVDGLSLNLLLRELAEAWAAFHQRQPPALPAVRLQHADVAAWQRTEPVRAREETQLGYWKRQLEDAPGLLQLPTDKPRPAVLSHRGGFVGYHPLPPALSQALLAFCRQHQVTPFMVLYAAFASLLHRYSGQEDFCVGIPSSGRSHPATEDVVGLLVNTLVLRTRVGPSTSFAGLLSQVRTTTLEAISHQDVPFERLVSALGVDRSPSHSPLIQVMFDLNRVDNPLAGAFADLQARSLKQELLSSLLDLSLSVVERPEGYELFIQYSTDLFEAGTVQRMLEHYLRLLGHAVAEPQTAVEALPLLSPAEREQVLYSFNDTGRPFDAEATIVSLFEAQVARTPGAPAVVAPEGTLTFRELSERASRLAAHLVAAGARPEAVVGLCLERSLDAVVSLLAIFMSGAACLPLEASHPASRRAALLRQARARLVVSRPALFEGVEPGVPMVDPADVRQTALPSSTPWPRASAENLAYLLYTSGSTGEPKGVELIHRNVVHCFAAFDPYYETRPGDCWASSGSLSFDIHLEELLFSITRGARTVLREVGPLGLGRDLVQHGITHVVITPSSLATALEEPGALEAFRSLKVLVTGGEVLPDPLVRQLALTRTTLVNTYGPTETSINVVAGRMRPGEPVRLGHPLDRCRIYVLDTRGEPVPPGVPGELFIGGTPLGRGYRERPELTAERFVPDAFSGVPGARLYRTGDRVRWNEDGSLSFLGRTDFQVKVRGVRIELEEVEAALLRQPGVRKAAVVVRGSQKDARLEAFLVLEGDTAREVARLREALSASLPEAMVPSRFVSLPELPFTTSGKVDRKALLALPVEASEAVSSGEAPRGPVEELLGQLFCQVLGLEKVHREDGFFELGGHSLSATRLVARIRQAFGAELPLAAFFSTPSISGLARALSKLQGTTAENLPAPTPRPAGSAPLLSFSQERMWFIQQLHPDSGAYHIPEAVELTGPLDEDTLEAALRWLLERHPVLRLAVPSREGQPQPVLQPLPLRLLLAEEWNGAATPQRIAHWLREEVHRPFSMDEGPLYRFRLLRTGPERHVLLLVFHHLLVDGLSLDILVRELAEAYRTLGQGRTPSLAPVRLDSSDIAAWQRTAPVRAREESQLEYWKRQLAGAPGLLRLPTDKPRPAVLSHQGGFTGHQALPSELVHALRAFCRQHQATPFMVLYTAFATLLHRYSRQTDFCVGTPVSGRSHPATEDTVGLLVNTLVLRTRLTPSASFAELLSQVRTTTLEAISHQDVPFERLVQTLDVPRTPSHSPLFQVLFDLNRVEHALADALPGLQGRPLTVESASSPLDFSLGILEGPDGYQLAIRYSTELFEAGTLKRLLGHYVQLLTHALREPHARLDTLPLLTPEENQDVLHAARAPTRNWPLDTCIHELFSSHARTAPQRVALAFHGGRWTYGELEAHTNRAAHRLVSQGVGPEQLVAVLGPRTEELIRAILSLHKAGGAYLPLDAQLPAARIAQLLAESRAPFVLPLGGTGERLSGALALLPAERRPRVLSLEGLDSESPEPLPRRATPGNLAYVVFTSGSTGTPKGVMIDHRSMLNHALGKQEDLGLTPEDMLSQTASMGFDISVWQMLGAFSFGGATYVVDDEMVREPPRMAAELDASGATFLEMVPSALQSILEDGDAAHAPTFRRLRWMLIGGQALPPALCRTWLERYPAVSFGNVYGPAECTDTTTMHLLRTAPSGGSTPIGTPRANLEAYVLDESLQPVPVGVVGELFIGGAGVGRGYLGRPEWTAERFVPHPFSARPGERLYRTGDLARLRADGLLEFVTRADFQVKVRGVRIELAEIEAALLALPEVRDAAVLARELHAGEKQLVAWVVPAGPGVESTALAQALARSLPAYMVPSRFLLLEALPLNANGKVDRKALEALPLDASETRPTGEPPRGPVEELLAQLFCQVLGVDQVHREEDFFRLGGHSLSATRLVVRVRQALGTELPLASFFASPTVAGLAALLGTAPRKEAEWKPSGQRPSRLPASLVQERLWYALQLPEAPPFVVVSALVLEGPLDVAKLEAALEAVVDRDDTLRTTFTQEAGTVFAQVNPRRAPVLTRTDLSHLPPEEARKAASAIATRHDLQPFDALRGPLYRFELVRLNAEGTRHVLVTAVSHLVLDGMGLQALLGEWTEAYRAAIAGQPSLLPPAPVQYADFALWQRRPEQLRRLDEGLESWKRALADAPPVLDVPLDFPRRAPALNANMRPVRLSLRAGDVAALKALARQEGVSTFTAMLALMQAWLHRLSAQSSVVVASPFSGRLLPGTERLVGYFTNVVPLCTDVSGEPSFRALLKRAHGTVVHATAHQEVPFKRIADAVHPDADRSAPPLAQALLLLDTLGAPAFEGLGVSTLEGESIIPAYDVVLHLVEKPEGPTSGVIATDSALFAPETAERMARAFEQLFSEAVRAPDVALSRLSILSSAQRAQVLAALDGGPQDVPAGACIHTLFEAQVRRSPDAPAVAHHTTTWSYAELNARANLLAARLVEQGLGPEDRVGVMMEPTAQGMAVLLGILKAGGTYVPLDPGWPEPRKRAVLERAGVRRLWVDAEAMETHYDYASVVEVPEQPEHVPGELVPGPREVSDAQLAYMIFTSGSTGEPKGVMVEHRSVVNHNVAIARSFGLRPGDRMLQFAPLSFDAAAEDLYPPLVVGATVVMRSGLVPAHAMTPYLEQEGITVISLPPTYIEEWIREMEAHGQRVPAKLHLLAPGGDVLKRETFESWVRVGGAHAPWVNVYGPTECTITSATCDIPGAEGVGTAPTFPIGRPIPRVRFYLLDEHMEPVLPGLPGKVYIGGAALSRGYLSAPDMTAERFVPDPFSREPGARMYSTGDLARLQPDGRLRFLGRADHQVKIRGFRIELSEIETCLRRFPEVEEAVVMARTGATGMQQLCAWVQAPAAVRAETLRAHVAAQLPTYMVPASFVVMERLPVNNNGKVDRKALPDPEAVAPAAPAFSEAPAMGLLEMPIRSTLEMALQRLWKEVLQQPEVNAGDNFFELGGDSLLAMRLLGRLEEEFGIPVPLATLFQYPVLRDTAEALREQLEAGPPPTSIVHLSGAETPEDAPALFFLHAGDGELHHYYPLIKRLGRKLRHFGIQAPETLAASPFATFDERIASYVKDIRTVQPHGPYRLLGYSYGGCAAFGVAAAFEAAGEKVELLALLDTFSAIATHAPRQVEGVRLMAQEFGVLDETLEGELAGMSLDAQWERVAERARDAGVVAPHFDGKHLARVWHVLGEVLVPQVQRWTVPALHGQVLLFTSEESRSIRDETLGWDQYVKREQLDLVPLPGSHAGSIHPPQVDSMAARLRAVLGVSGE
ncbi:amino acid adenylation domain-containing protein [Archangium violaceum]|uniref:amino acid adenylation domain-containing protein n=1 Tax=Archangium violaceum TaxID=83451 RepID=UPI0036D9D98D